MYKSIKIIAWALLIVVAVTLLVLRANSVITTSHAAHITVAKTNGALPADQQAFIRFMLPIISAVNDDVIVQRKQLLALYFIWVSNQKLTSAQQTQLTKLAQIYKSPYKSFTNLAAWKDLISRVNVIPPALVLAQAIEESGWGQSRFAKQVYNYFGQRCYKPGCGMIPAGRAEGAIYQIKRFASVKQSVQSYIHNLNSEAKYQSFRSLRQQLTNKEHPLTSLNLAGALTSYSQLGKKYVTKIRHIIIEFNLDKYDRQIQQGNLTPPAIIKPAK